MKTASAIHHVHFENLVTLERLPHRCSYRTEFLDIRIQALDFINVGKADRLVVLGICLGAQLIARARHSRDVNGISVTS